MFIAYVVTTVLLAVAFAVGGVQKAALTGKPKELMNQQGLSDPMIRAAGSTETLAAIGLIVGIWVPWLGVAAAAGLVTQMLIAVGWHLARKHQAPEVIPALSFAVVSAVVLVLRLATM